MSRKRTPRLPVFSLRAVAEIGRDVKGATAVEYGLIAALIVVVIIGALHDVGDAVLGLPLSAVIDALAGVIS